MAEDGFQTSKYFFKKWKKKKLICSHRSIYIFTKNSLKGTLLSYILIDLLWKSLDHANHLLCLSLCKSHANQFIYYANPNQPLISWLISLLLQWCW